MKTDWIIEFKVEDKKMKLQHKKGYVLSHVKMDIQTWQLPYVLQMIYAEIDRLRKENKFKNPALSSMPISNG